MSNVRFFFLLGAFVAIVLAAVVTQAAEVTANLEWTAPTERTDGTPLAPEEIANYRVYYGVDSPPGDEPVAVIEGQAETLTIDLAPRPESYTVQFAVTAVDADGRESERSNVVAQSFMVTSTAAPSAPTRLRIEIACASGDCQIVLVE